MIDELLLSKFRTMLIEHEGLELKPYRCTAGKLTIGVGRNLEDVGISKNEAILLLENDIRRTSSDVEKTFLWLKRLDQPRQIVILSMAFNMGVSKLKEFKNLIKALEASDYDKAANEMMNSLWASQVKKRAADLAGVMKTGQF